MSKRNQVKSSPLIADKLGKFNGKQTRVVVGKTSAVVTRYHKVPGKVSSLFSARFAKGTKGYKVAKEWALKADKSENLLLNKSSKKGDNS